MHISAVQLDTRWEDRQANHARVRELLAGAGLAPDTLIVLPEMFDTGFSMNPLATDPGEPSASERFCRELAAETGCAMLAGVTARAAATTAASKLANEAVAFSPAGAELCRYRKQRPFTPPGEHLRYVAGTAHSIFDWRGVRISPFICYDLRFPELFRPAALAGAECLIVIANWPNARSEHWLRLLQARAIENQAFVLGVNRCGQDPTLSYDGLTSLFDPLGKQILGADAKEGVYTAEIDGGAARSWRERFPALRDALPA
jgi:predicted amidohydrolase